MLDKYLSYIMSLCLVIIYLICQGEWIYHLVPFRSFRHRLISSSPTFRTHSADLYTLWGILEVTGRLPSQFYFTAPFLQNQNWKLQQHSWEGNSSLTISHIPLLSMPVLIAGSDHEHGSLISISLLGYLIIRLINN